MNDTKIDVTWHDHPDRVPAAAWQLPGAREACLSLAYLRATHDGGLAFVDGFHYATAHAGAVVVGLLVAFVLEVEAGEVFGPGPFRVLVLSDAMGMCRPPLLVTGEDADDRRRVIDALAAAAEARARGQRAEGIHVYWLGEGAVELRGALAERGYIAMPEDACAHVPLLAGQLGDYPAPMRSNYRSVIKRKRQRLASLAIVVRCPPAPPDIATIERLYGYVAERKEEERPELVDARFTRRFFELALADPAFRMAVCERPDGRLLGYLLGVCSGDTFVSLVVGLDYAAIAADAAGLASAVYQEVHACALAQAQRDGARWAVLGISALEGKARLGALCERNWGMAIGLTERAWAAASRAQAAGARGGDVPACRPYADAAYGPIAAEAARRGVILAEPGEDAGTGAGPDVSPPARRGLDSTSI
jgi:hypothetical protein